MRGNYSSFEEGDILVLELPFTDLTGKKLRPVLVVSNKELNRISKDLIVIKISSAKQIEKYEVRIGSNDLAYGKLKKKSYIHPYSIFAIEKSIIFAKIGKIKPEKLKQVKTIMRNIFSL